MPIPLQLKNTTAKLASGNCGMDRASPWIRRRSGNFWRQGCKHRLGVVEAGVVAASLQQVAGGASAADPEIEHRLPLDLRRQQIEGRVPAA
jgi:hypothetical protein